MLVLSRRKKQEIVLIVAGRTIHIRIVDVRGKRVRLGVTAPSDVAVQRDEIWNRMHQWRPNNEVCHGPANKVR